MIDRKSHNIECISSLRNKLGKRVDPKLIEKVIYALTFLEQLKLHGLESFFKGGTALLLATEIPKRFSIDIDIITLESIGKITMILEEISKLDMFIRWEEDDHRKHSPDAPIGHYKMFYKSVVDDNEEPYTARFTIRPKSIPQNQRICNRT